LNENEIKVRDFILTVNNHDTEGMGKFLAENYIHQWVGIAPSISKTNFLQAISSFFDAFPDYSTNIEQIFTTDDHVILEWSGKGTHTKKWLGIPATQKNVQWQYVAIIEIRDGCFQKIREYFDSASFFKQIGIIEKSFFG